MTPKHTPTPYKILDEKAVWPLIESTTEPYDSCGYKGLRTVAEVNGTTLFDKLATAKFIVESCNNYERVKAALEKALKMIEYVGCKECGGAGAVQISEDEVHQCQWCAEKDYIKQALKEYGDK
jgi:hypothetical protein